MDDSIKAEEVEFHNPGFEPEPASTTLIVQPEPALAQAIEVEALGVEVATAELVKAPKSVLATLVLQVIVAVMLAVIVTEVALAECGEKT